MTEKLKGAFTADSLCRFYMSNIYPIVICALTLIGSVTGVEMYLGLIHSALIFGAFIVCPSIKPIVISLLTFVMQLSVPHSPFYPNYSDYYYTGWRLIAFIAIVALVLSGFVIFTVKNRIYKKLSFKDSPFLIPLILLSSAFLLNGIFSGKWVLGSLVFGFSNLVVWCVLFLLMYHGFGEDESAESLAGYFAYISVLISFLISAELIVHFLTADNIFVDGSINKVAVALGWGIWNLIGVSLSVLIPVIFYGMHKNKYPWMYFTAATLAYIMAVLTMSRNALVFATLAYVSCVIISCFYGKQKRTFRIIAAAGILCVAALGIILFDKLYAILADYFERGFSDNGRFDIWRAAFDNFLAHPIFGGGFYGFEGGLDKFGPLAKQAHNTLLQILSATGILGFAAYAYYRYKTVLTVIKKPTFLKTMMALSIAVLLLGSLLDNFVFNIYPMFYYNMAMVIVCKATAEGEKS